MTLAICNSSSAATWLTRSNLPWQQLATFGPADFDSYVRLRFIPDPAGKGQRETDATKPRLTEAEILLLTTRTLRDFTETPEHCYYCIWDGWGLENSTRIGEYTWGNLVEFAKDVSKVTIPHRSYYLLEGALSDFAGWVRSDDSASNAPIPAFIWPAGHEWCVAKDVDPHYAGIGASLEAAQQLVSHPRLDAVYCDPAGEQPSYDG